MTGFNIDPDGLRRGADGLSETVERMAEGLTQLETKLQGYGSPWGSGIIGQVIGQLYQEIHDLALSTYEGNTEVISEYAQGLDSMADTLEENEQEIESGLLDVRDALQQSFPGGRP